MKIQFAQSSREIEAIKVTKFNVIQDNRSKQIVAIEYNTTNGVRECLFMNNIEVVLNSRNRYVQAQSNRDYCARILPEPEIVEVQESAK
jgi:hypothetical protein